MDLPHSPAYFAVVASWKGVEKVGEEPKEGPSDEEVLIDPGGTPGEALGVVGAVAEACDAGATRREAA